MKNKPLQLGYFERNFFKNHQIFIEKVYQDERFFGEILEWHIKLKLVKRDLGDIFTIKSFRNHEKAQECGLKLLEKVRDDQNMEFMEWFCNFCDKHDLPKTWEPTIRNFIACGYYCPPETANLTITSDGNKVTVLLEPTASLNDLKQSWPLIAEKLERLKSTPKRRISKSFFKNIEEQIKAGKLKKGTYNNWEQGTEEKENTLDILYKLHGEDEKKLEEIESDPKKAVARFKLNKYRTKGFIK